jgi:hypothetical protein
VRTVSRRLRRGTSWRMEFGLIGLLVVILLIVLIVYFVRRA